MESLKFQNDSDIASYLDCVDQLRESFRNNPPETFQLVQQVDELIREVWSRESGREVESSFLAINAYLSFMSAINVAISGHSSSVFPIIRTALESACYAFLLNTDTDLLSIWRNRDKSPESTKECRKKLTGAIKDTVKIVSSIQPEVANYIQELYDASITFGAHPNPRSIFSHLEIQDGDDIEFWKVNFNCLYPAEHSKMTQALIACAEYGIVIAYLNTLSLKEGKRVGLEEQFNRVNDYKNFMEDKLRAG